MVIWSKFLWPDGLPDAILLWIRKETGENGRRTTLKESVWLRPVFPLQESSNAVEMYISCGEIPIR